MSRRIRLMVPLLLVCSVLGNRAAAQEIKLVQISTLFNTPIGIDYHQPTNSVVVSVNYSGGQPRNFEKILLDGSHVPFSSVAGFTNEVKIATVRDGNPGGFTTGDLFVGNGVDGEIAMISDDGATVVNPWVSLPGGGNGLMRGSLYVDRTGVWGGDLIACTTSGQIWRIQSDGTTSATPLASIGTHLEGLITVPDDAAYGPIAGKAICGAEGQGLLYAIDTGGNVESFNVGVNVEDIDFIEAGANFFGVNFGTNRILGAQASEFEAAVGGILLTQEFHSGSGLFNLEWDGANLVATELTLTDDSENPGQWEHVTFAPAGIAPIGSCPIFEDPTPCFETFNVLVGETVNFDVLATDPDLGDTILLTATGVPAGAVLSPPLPTVGNPVSTSFNWTPTNADAGTVTEIAFTATDDSGCDSQCTIRIEVEAKCFLLVGGESIERPIGNDDTLLVLPRRKTSRYIVPVTLEDIPPIRIPNKPSLEGRHVYFQIYMHNESVFPEDPYKMSNGLDMVIGSGNLGVVYGPATGMTLWSLTPANLGGEVLVSFTIDD